MLESRLNRNELLLLEVNADDSGQDSIVFPSGRTVGPVRKSPIDVEKGQEYSCGSIHRGFLKKGSTMPHFLRRRVYPLVLFTGLMQGIRKYTFDVLLLAVGILLLVAAFSGSQRVNAQSTCVANPPPGCIWEVIDSFCTHVGACSTPQGCACVDILMFSNGCCYVEIGEIIPGGNCKITGCTTFKKCCLGTCNN